MGNKPETGRSGCGGGILGDIGNILGKKKMSVGCRLTGRNRGDREK